VELGESLPAPSIRSPMSAKASSAAQSRATARRPEKRDNAQGRSGVDESSADAGLVVVLNVMARAGQTFAGPSLKLALEGAGLKPGDMQLYHYRAETQADDTPPIFSALNAVKPGTLDVNAFDDMRTPGIALILRTPELERPSESFELMLVAARRMAGELDGQVCDDSRSTLTGQALNHLRERIAAVAFHARSGS
jgi:cell division protein ZipA